MPVNIREIFDVPQRLDELETLLRGRVRRAGDVMSGSLTVGGDLTVVGKRLEVVAAEQQSTQLVVENLGTGPALVVKQAGAGVPLARFVDSDNDAAVVIHDAGTVGIGVEVPSVGVRLEVAGIIKAEGLQVGNISFDSATGADLPYATSTVSGVVLLTTSASDPFADARDYAVVTNVAFRDWLAGTYAPHFDGGHDDRYVRLAGAASQDVAGDLRLPSGSLAVPAGHVEAVEVRAQTYVGLPVATAAEPGIVRVQDGAAVAASADALAALTTSAGDADAATRAWAEERFLNASGDALDDGAALDLGGGGSLAASTTGGSLAVGSVTVLGDPYASWGNLPRATGADGRRGTVILAAADFLSAGGAIDPDAAAPATAVSALRAELVSAAAAQALADAARFADVAGDTFTGDVVVASGARLDVRGGRDAWLGLPVAGLADGEWGVLPGLSSAIDSTREDRAATSLAVSLLRGSLEQTIAEVQELASAEYLPLAGGTLTGDLSVGASATVVHATGAATFAAIAVTGPDAYSAWVGLPVAGTAGDGVRGVVSLTDDPSGDPGTATAAVAASAAALAGARTELAAARVADQATVAALRADFDGHFAGGHDDRYLRLETGGTVLGAVSLAGGASTPTLAVTTAFAPETVSASVSGTRGVTSLSSATTSAAEDRAATPLAVSTLGAALRAEAAAQFVDAAGDTMTGSLRLASAAVATDAEAAAVLTPTGDLRCGTVTATTYVGIPVASTASAVPGLTTLSDATDGSAGTTAAATSRAVGDLGTALRAELVDAAGDTMTGTLRFVDAAAAESAAVDPLTGRVSARVVSAGTYLNLPYATQADPGVVLLRDATDVDDPTTAASSRAVAALQAQLDQAPGAYVDVSGDTMTGPLALGDVLLDPATSSVTATRYYGLPYAQVSTVAGDAGTVLLTDDPLFPGAPRTDLVPTLAATRALDAGLRAWGTASFVDVSGDAMTGDLAVGAGVTLRAATGEAVVAGVEVTGDPYTSWKNLPVATSAEPGVVRVSASLTLDDATVAASASAAAALRAALDQHDRAAILSATDATEVRALEDRVRVRNVNEGVDLAVFDAVTRNFEVLHGGVVGQWAHLLSSEDFSVPGAFAGGAARLSLMCEGDAAAREVLLHSDARLKAEVRDLGAEEAWAALLAARPRSYVWARDPGLRARGFVAQELLESPATAGLVRAVPDADMVDGRRLVVSYTDLIAPMVAAMRDLQARVAELEELVRAKT